MNTDHKNTQVLEKQIITDEKNTTKPNLDHLMNLEELWIELANFSKLRVDDNVLCKEQGDGYPLSVRKMQMVSLQALVDAINLRHEELEMNNKNNNN